MITTCVVHVESKDRKFCKDIQVHDRNVGYEVCERVCREGLLMRPSDGDGEARLFHLKDIGLMVIRDDDGGAS